MNHAARRTLALLSITLLTSGTAAATERSQVASQYQWDLSALFPSEVAWTKAKDDLARFREKWGRELGRQPSRPFRLDRDSWHALPASDEPEGCGAWTTTAWFPTS